MKPGVDMIRKSIYRLIFITIFIFTFTSLYAQTKMSIAVLPLSSNGISPSEALVLTDELLSVLVQSNTYIVVERSNMESILKAIKKKNIPESISKIKWSRNNRLHFVVYISVWLDLDGLHHLRAWDQFI